MLLMVFLRRRQPEKQRQTALAFMIAVCGMTGMALNLLLVLNFQEVFGSIYKMVGAMIAANMLGLALGTLIASRLVKKYKQKILLFTVLIVLVGVVILLPNLLNFLVIAQFIPLTLFMTIVSGGLIGMIFGITNRGYLHRLSHAGSMYAFDVFGSSIGALTTCSVLLPVLGLQGTAIFLALILSPALAATVFMGKTD
jgi:predicted membrane-bound spermidine synthase